MLKLILPILVSVFHNEYNPRIGRATAVTESIIISFEVPKSPVLNPGKNGVEANGRVYGPSAPLEKYMMRVQIALD